MFLGKIISKNKKFAVIDFIEITDNTEINEKNTLIVGKPLAESLYGKERIKVLDKHIENNVYWTFAKTERRNDYEQDVEEFNKRVAKFIKSSVEYRYFNFFTETFDHSSRFIKWLYEGDQKYVYIKSNHIYIYTPNSKLIFGFSFNDTEYLGKDTEAIIEKIKANPNNIIVEDDNFLQNKTREYFLNCQYLIPYFYFLYTN